MKRCSKCGEWKDESEFYNTRAMRCKACISAYAREYYAAHRAERIAYAVAWASTHPHPQRNKAQKAAYRAAHKSERYAYKKAWGAAHPEWRIKQYVRNYFRYNLGITPTQELFDLKAKQIALVRAIRKQKEAKA